MRTYEKENGKWDIHMRAEIDWKIGLKYKKLATKVESLKRLIKLTNLW